MMKRLGALAALLLAMGLLCGCGLLNNEYVSIKDYTPSVQEESSDDGKVTVKNFSALKQALLKMAYAGKTEGTIVFDAAYDGDTTADMASACWQVRTQDALCAYCVENMAYEINKIVTISEASVYISYSDVSEAAGAIRHLAFSSGIDDIIRDAFSEGEKKLVVLISRSSYSAEDMAAAVTRVYREDPALVPKEPLASVNMYSGTGAQRLYEISINYGMTSDELDARTAQLQAVDAFAELDTSGMSEAELAYAACEYLMEHCTVSEDKSENTAYAARRRAGKQRGHGAGIHRAVPRAGSRLPHRLRSGGLDRALLEHRAHRRKLLPRRHHGCDRGRRRGRLPDERRDGMGTLQMGCIVLPEVLGRAALQ